MKLSTRRRMLMIADAKHSRLPNEYQEVEWLRGTGTQYCITAFHAYYNGTTFLSIRGDIEILNRDSKIRINSASESSYYGIEHTGTVCTIGVSPNQSYGTGFSESLPYNIHYEINRNACIINETVYSTNWSQFNMQNNIVIGKRSPSSDYYNQVYDKDVLIKAISIYENDTLISEIIPCFRKSDGVAGFYQTNVSEGYDNFITNLGTGDDWLIGPNV